MNTDICEVKVIKPQSLIWIQTLQRGLIEN